MDILFHQNIAIKLCKYIKLKMNKVCLVSHKNRCLVFTELLFYIHAEKHILNGIFVFLPQLYFW